MKGITSVVTDRSISKTQTVTRSFQNLGGGTTIHMVVTHKGWVLKSIQQLVGVAR